MILSIENHCCVVQQKKMAQYLTDILGDKLDLSAVSSEDASTLPSPQMLRGKILVKVRPLGWLGPDWPGSPCFLPSAAPVCLLLPGEEASG